MLVQRGANTGNMPLRLVTILKGKNWVLGRSTLYRKNPALSPWFCSLEIIIYISYIPCYGAPFVFLLTGAV